MARHWYAWKPDTYLYDRPAASKTQIRKAERLLRTTGMVPVDDYDAHVGALSHRITSGTIDLPRSSRMVRRKRARQSPGKGPGAE